MEEKPWVSFCISTFKRPEFIRNQINSLLNQTFPQFEIVISDNDPDASAQDIVRGFDDKRVRYFPNGENLGMIRSFNKSIDRAIGDYIVMVTDDDPIENGFLSAMFDLEDQYPGYSLYAGFRRNNKRPGNIEKIEADSFISEILDPNKTSWFLWSSCIIKREIALLINKIPDYGSPHLADHAFIVMSGSMGGGIVVNTAFSSLTSHDTNFSKSNFDYYIDGCKGFYNIFLEFCIKKKSKERSLKIVKKHLNVWFISCIFNLKRFYTIKKRDEVALKHVEECARKILSLPFMSGNRGKYFFKGILFEVKKSFGLLR